MPAPPFPERGLKEAAIDDPHESSGGQRQRIGIAMAGSQKGLMTPPDLGFVAAGKRARDAHRKAGLRTPYWDWSERDGDSHYQKYAAPRRCI